MSAFLPPVILLAVAFFGYLGLTRFMVRRNERIRTSMPDATVDEWAEAALAEGRSGKLVLAMFPTLVVAVTGAAWLLIVCTDKLL